MNTHEPKSYDGFKGFLIYFLLGIIGTAAYALYTAYSYSQSLATYIRKLPSNLSIEFSIDTLLFAVLALMCGFTTYLIVKRRRIAVRWVIIAALLTMLAYTVDAAVTQSIYATASQPAPADLYGGAGRAVVIGTIWIIYFLESKRVKATLNK